VGCFLDYGRRGRRKSITARTSTHALDHWSHQPSDSTKTEVARQSCTRSRETELRGSGDAGPKMLRMYTICQATLTCLIVGSSANYTNMAFSTASKCFVVRRSRRSVRRATGRAVMFTASTVVGRQENLEVRDHNHDSLGRINIGYCVSRRKSHSTQLVKIYYITEEWGWRTRTVQAR